jgi:hypothetical protein
MHIFTLDTQYLRDMAQLADIVRQVETLRAEKARTHRYRREQVSYIDTNESDQESNIAFEYFKDSEVNVVELNPGPPYTCKLLRPSYGKIPLRHKMISTLPKHIHSI